MKRHIITAILVLFSFGQSAAQHDQKHVSLPDSIMERVFREIVESNFKPAQEHTTVYFFDRGIRWEWFPDVKNVYFVLLSESQIKGHEVFFVKDVKRDGDEFEVYYGRGDPYCSASGQIWRFTVDGEAVKARLSGGWGSGCSRGGSTVR